MRCLWRKEESEQQSEETITSPDCGAFAISGRSMWEHIVTTHLGLSKDADNKYEFEPHKTSSCRWASCRHFDGAAPGDATSFAVGMHVKTHLPDSSERSYQRSKHNVAPEAEHSKVQPTFAVAGSGKRTWQTRNTATDERNDAAGLPLTSVLVLRNLATQLPRTATADVAGGSSLVRRYFEPVREHIFEVMACNSSLKEYLPGLVRLLDQAGEQLVENGN